MKWCFSNGKLGILGVVEGFGNNCYLRSDNRPLHVLNKYP